MTKGISFVKIADTVEVTVTSRGASQLASVGL
jgi:hypothetical protein